MYSPLQIAVPMKKISICDVRTRSGNNNYKIFTSIRTHL